MTPADFAAPPMTDCPRCGAPGAVLAGSRAICEACRGKEREAAARADRIAKAEATIPPGYGWCVFGASLPAPAAYVQRARELVAKRARRVTIIGSSGKGKTSLVTAMMRSWLALHGEAALWLHAHAIAKGRAQHRLGAGEAAIVAQAITAPLLVLDELRDDGHGLKSALYDVIQERHANGAATWVTTGMGLDVAEARAAVALAYGDGTARRLFEQGVHVLDLSKPPPTASQAPPRAPYDARRRAAGDDS